FAAPIWAALDPLGRESTIGRNKNVFELDVLAAGAGEADHVPGVDDRVVARGHQKHAVLALPGLLVADHGAEHIPGCGIDAARKRPAAAQPITALHAPGAAARENQGRADQAIGRVAPDLVLRLRV